MSEGLSLIENQTNRALADDISAACDRIPPLWDLPNFVAVNPFLGFADRPIEEAAQEVGDTLRAQVLPPISHYQKRWNDDAFGFGDLDRAARRAGLDPLDLVDILEQRSLSPLRPARPLATFAELVDKRRGSTLQDAVMRSVARWCAAHALGGGALWKWNSETSDDLYASWREAMSVDYSLEILGVDGWRDHHRELPESAEATIELLLDRLEISEKLRLPYLYRLLGTLTGWAGYFRREGWEQGSREHRKLKELLAVLISADAAVAALEPTLRGSSLQSELRAVEDESVRLVFQEAWESAYARQLLGSMRPVSALRDRQRPSVQAIFCIDVRSEPLRRFLEAQSPTIETRGFAGFFGASLSLESDGEASARCPVLLKPGVVVKSGSKHQGKTGRRAIKALQTAPAASFSFVEVFGMGYGLGLATEALTAVPNRLSGEGRESFSLESVNEQNGLVLNDRVNLAAGILKNMGLRESFARLILLCGHEGRSANNPHAAGLHCGACGGHGGAINARVASAVLNDPEVRQGLRPLGWTIPEDSWFVPGVHDTSIDEVSLLDVALIPRSHAEDLEQLRQWLKAAAAGVRAERAPALGVEAKSPGILARLFQRRARDWSEVRPEWALARNAAFIAARRDRTRGVDLEGRTFLHEYDASMDTDNSILTLILSAPMVVASWINLQYFASTVDNNAFGSGNKTIHNRIGTHGVLLGNGGDIRTGLALQSVHQPNGVWYHQPLRLQVIVEASTDRIDEVLEAREDVRQLIENGWVRLYAIDPDSTHAKVWFAREGWRAVEAID